MLPQIGFKARIKDEQANDAAQVPNSSRLALARTKIKSTPPKTPKGFPQVTA
ncbi:hypothetical protein LBMAG15_19970 [Actinomycetes bacterium]|nr:hypothetical protein LBMAG15_19970 [Actinomycetes bacterium]